HSRAVSYPGLVFQVDDAEGPHQLALEVVPLVVHGGAAERGDGRRVVDELAHRLAAGVLALPVLAEGGVARRLDALGDAVHGPVKGFGFGRVGGRGGAVPDLGDAVGVDRQLEGGGPLGAEGAAADGALWVAFNVDDLVVADADDLAAADGAVRADAGHFAG